MILIALGANLPSSYGPPRETCVAALNTLASRDVRINKISRWYESSPVPASDQPWYVNGVAVVETKHSSVDLLSVLLEVESEFGRKRSVQNAARTLDLDLLAYHDELRTTAPLLPHPRLQDRAFVLLPLKDVAPDWRHPVTDAGLDLMISGLEDPNSAVPLP